MKTDFDNRMKAESKFDPLSDPQDKEVITGKHASRSAVVFANNADSLLKIDTSSMKPVTNDSLLTLFRVQIYVSKSVDEAQQYATSIKKLFPEGIFVEYQAPYYKVRVGEFHLASEGQSFLDHVKQLGFENAWLVRVMK